MPARRAFVAHACYARCCLSWHHSRCSRWLHPHCLPLLQAALEFAAWSATSPADRAAALRMQVRTRRGALQQCVPAVLADRAVANRVTACCLACCVVRAVQARVAAELRSSARMAAICEWGSRRALPTHVSAGAASAAAAAEAEEHGQLPWPAGVDWAGELELPEPPAAVAWSGGGSGPPSPPRPAHQHHYARQAAVQELLAANEALLARLAV